MMRYQKLFQKTPSVYTIQAIDRLLSNDPDVIFTAGSWVPARPEGYWSFVARLKATWLVFAGRGDVVLWENNEYDR